MTAQIFGKKKSSVKLPKQKQEGRRDEYGRSKQGIAVCKVCHGVKYKKEWHSPEGAFIKMGRHSKGDVHLVICPACSMVKGGVYEGEIKIDNVPVKIRTEILKLVAAYGARARKRDPQDRIVNIKKEGSSFVITTTENQLAVRLAKKIYSTFKKSELKISHGKEPHEVSRISISF
jgi:hypothetical protein